MSVLGFLEINLPEGRKTRVRADTIAEIREDFMAGPGGKNKRQVVRIILTGGANMVVEGETIDQFWTRYQTAMQRNLVVTPAPYREPGEI
jgi:hypothetical protein